MSSDARLRALERSGDRQGYLRECWRVGGVGMFEAALRPRGRGGGGLRVRGQAALGFGGPGHPVRGGPAGAGADARVPNGVLRDKHEWRVNLVRKHPLGPDTWLVSWLRPRGLGA